MESKLIKSKIKIALIGNGGWGSQVENVIKLINRYDLVGTINTKTEEEKKRNILEKSDMWYIAVPQESQLEYVKMGLENKKHIICETPVLNSMSERKEIYEMLLKNSGNKKVFYCNFPYFLDKDFGRLMSGGLIRKAKFFSIKCMGPKFKDDPEKAKKFYVNQVFNLIFNTCAFVNIRNFDRFIIEDNFFGQFHSGDITYLFEWGYSEYPKIDITIKGSNYSKSSELIYDRYDQIMPILINFSDKIMGIEEEIPESYAKALENENDDLINKLSLSSYLTACSAEYFSDVFCKLAGRPCNIQDTSKLFLNGGFQDQNYSIIENL